MRSTDFVSRTISRDLQQRPRPAPAGPVDEIKTGPDVWYCADQNRPVGPFTFEDLLAKLIPLSNASNALVWCDRFSGWKRAGDVSEIRPHILAPPPLPDSTVPQLLPCAVHCSSDHNKPAWRWNFRWWWLIAALPVVVLLSAKIAVGNHLGRSELERLSVERRARKKANKANRAAHGDAG
jgi:hypothetical protein